MSNILFLDFIVTVVPVSYRSFLQIFFQFEKGERNQAAIDAYTEFCSKYDQCGRLYDDWMIKNTELKKFFDVIQSNKLLFGKIIHGNNLCERFTAHQQEFNFIFS